MEGCLRVWSIGRSWLEWAMKVSSCFLNEKVRSCVVIVTRHRLGRREVCLAPASIGKLVQRKGMYSTRCCDYSGIGGTTVYIEQPESSSPSPASSEGVIDYSRCGVQGNQLVSSTPNHLLFLFLSENQPSMEIRKVRKKYPIRARISLRKVSRYVPIGIYTRVRTRCSPPSLP